MLLLCPIFASANDGGSFFDDLNLVSIDVDFKSYEAAIGEPFEFSVSLTNNTLYDFSAWAVSRFFEHQEWDRFIIDEDYGLDDSLDSDKTVTYDLSYIIPEDVFWYKTEDGFFIDFNLEMSFWGPLYKYEHYRKYLNDGESWDFIDNYGPIPIRLKNIFDGSDMARMEMDYDFDQIYFSEHNLNSFLSDGKLLGEFYNDITIYNISDFKLNNLFIHRQLKEDNERRDKTFYSLDPNLEFRKSVENYYIYSPKSIPSNIKIDYGCIFNVDGTYFGISENLILPTYTVKRPNIEINKIESDSDKSIIEVTNNSYKSLDNFYLSLTGYYSEDKLYDRIEGKESVQIEIENDSRYIYFGKIRDGMLFLWESPIEGEVFWFSEIIIINKEKEDMEAADAPTPSLELTPKPSSALESSMKPKTELVDIEITVEKVEEKSAVPIWVWVAVIIALLSVGFLIFYLRKKSNSDEKEK